MSTHNMWVMNRNAILVSTHNVIMNHEAILMSTHNICLNESQADSGEYPNFNESRGDSDEYPQHML